MKSYCFFFFSSSRMFRRWHSTSTCRNQHLRALSDFVIQRMCCRLQFASCPCACVPFSSASGGTPPSRTLPPLRITNSAGWQLCDTTIILMMTWESFHYKVSIWSFWVIDTDRKCNQRALIGHWHDLVSQLCMMPKCSYGLFKVRW